MLRLPGRLLPDRRLSSSRLQRSELAARSTRSGQPETGLSGGCCRGSIRSQRRFRSRHHWFRRRRRHARQRTLPEGLQGCSARSGEASVAPQTFHNDEWFAFNQLAWLDKRTTSGNWRVAKDFPNLPAWTCKTVGGTTVHWAGASLRLQEHEFKAKTTYSDVTGANLLDWPMTLADLEPYYAKAEDKMGVTRTNDIPGLPGNNNFKVMYNGATRVGYKTVHTGRMAINSRPRDDRSSCWQLGFCFQGCKSGAKWSTLYTEIPKAEATGKLDLRPQSQALQIQHDDQRQGDRRAVRRQGRQARRAEGADRLRRLQLDRNAAAPAQFVFVDLSAGAGELLRPGRQELHAAYDRARCTRFSRSRCICIAAP